MKTICLTMTQRINLHGMLGAMQCPAGTLRAVWALMDRLALTPAEEEQIGLRKTAIGTRISVDWDTAKEGEPSAFELNQQERAFVKDSILMTAPAAANREWLAPVMDFVEL
jgi:hypothetical protein